MRRAGNNFTWDGRDTRRFFFSSGNYVIRSGTNELSVLLGCVRCGMSCEFFWDVTLLYELSVLLGVLRC